MYAAFWRSLPGPWWVKAIITVVIAVIVFLLLMNYIFPWVAELIPSNDVSL